MWKKLALFALFASQMGATDCGGVIKDPGFDVWCGDALCAWKVEKGDIARAPTWHDKDSGVAFVGDDVAIEQLAPVDDGDAQCIAFDMIADVETDAEVELNIDLEGDGTVEKTETIPSAHWAPLHYVIAVAGPYDGIRFELAKHGDGKVVVAQIEAKTAEGECDGLTAISVTVPRVDGARCTQNADCASNACGNGVFTGTCFGCTAEVACGSGDVCGVGTPTSPIYNVPFACVPHNAKATGEQCFDGDECASTICATGVCSACDPLAANTCPDGLQCKPAYTTAMQPAPNAMYVCGAQSGAVASGGACGSDGDCASGHCAGPVREQCDDGRACETAGNCPAESGLEPGPCTTVGTQGGTCQ